MNMVRNLQVFSMTLVSIALITHGKINNHELEERSTNMWKTISYWPREEAIIKWISVTVML